MKSVIGVNPNRNRYTLASAGVLLLIAMPGWAVTPVEVAKLVADDGATNDFFGFSVALSGDTAVIGAFRDSDDVKGVDSGSAYVFIRTGGAWIVEAKLTGSSQAFGSMFGWSVAIDGDTAAVGALGDFTNGPGSGAVYVFTRSNGVWTEQAKLTASDASNDHNFGRSVAISGDTAIVGAYLEDTGGGEAGAAYVFLESSLKFFIGDALAMSPKLPTVLPDLPASRDR